jgi:hypothetical protein
MDRHSAGRIVCRVARRDGLDKKIGPRTLRHAFIIAALDIGVPRRDVQVATSHADPRTTTRYDGGRISLDPTPPTSSLPTHRCPLSHAGCGSPGATAIALGFGARPTR